MARLFEGLSSSTIIVGDGKIWAFDTILLQVNLESSSLNGWLTRTECMQHANGDIQHRGLEVTGSCVEELSGYVLEDGDWMLETTNIIEMHQSVSAWGHFRYILRVSEDGQVLVGKAQPLELSHIQGKYKELMDKNEYDAAKKLRTQMEVMQGGSQEGVMVEEQRLRLRVRDKPNTTKLRWEGMTSSHGQIGNHTHQSWNLVVLEWDGEDAEVSASLLSMNCLKQVDGRFEPLDEVPHYIRQWGLEFGGALETLIGNFDAQTKNLILQGTQVNQWGLNYTRWPPYNYTLRMSDDNSQIIGERKEVRGEGASGVVRLIAKRHMLVNVSPSSGSSITCMNMVGDVLAELQTEEEETVKDFRVRLAASLPNRGLAIDMLKIVLPTGALLDEDHNCRTLVSLL